MAQHVMQYSRDLMILKMYQDLHGLDENGLLVWSAEEVRLSLSMRDANGFTIVQRAMASGNAWRVAAVFEARKIAEDTKIQTLKTVDLKAIGHRLHHQSINDHNTRVRYTRLLREIMRFEERPANERTESIEGMIQCFRQIYAILVRNQEAQCVEGESILQGVNDIFDYFQWETQHGNREAELAHSADLCPLCLMYRVNPVMLELLINHCKSAVEKLGSYLRAFVVFDCLKRRGDMIEITNHWRPQFARLYDQNHRITALGYALLRGNLQAVRFLLQSSMFNLVRTEHRRPHYLFMAVHSRQSTDAMLHELFQRIPQEHWAQLLKHQQAKEGLTALHYAAKRGNELGVVSLCEYGSMYNSMDLEGRTPWNLTLESNNPTQYSVSFTKLTVYSKQRADETIKFISSSYGGPPIGSKPKLQ